MQTKTNTFKGISIQPPSRARVVERLGQRPGGQPQQQARYQPSPPTGVGFHNELRLPRARLGDARQLVLVIVIQHARAVGAQVSVLIVNAIHRGGQVDGDGVCSHES